VRDAKSSEQPTRVDKTPILLSLVREPDETTLGVQCRIYRWGAPHGLQVSVGDDGRRWLSEQSGHLEYRRIEDILTRFADPAYRAAHQL
jgi:hypothetical protein